VDVWDLRVGVGVWRLVGNGFGCGVCEAPAFSFHLLRSADYLADYLAVSFTSFISTPSMRVLPAAFSTAS
jgi:hypothetical protein